MATPFACDELRQLCDRINDCMQPFAGRVEYGNLRSHISEFDCGNGEHVTNIALVYETPGGSTDQINIEFRNPPGIYTLIDAHEGERSTQCHDDVLLCVQGRIESIPIKRRETLEGEIRRQIDSGSNTMGLVGHLNRMMNSGFKGGTITHHEMRDAMTFAVQYMKGKL
jgi:hypothetical protein